MIPVRLLLLAVLPLVPHAPLSAQADDAAAIMARVAENQEEAEAERAHYTYVQHVDAASRKGHRVLCREVTDSRVTPVASGSSRQLLKLEGSLWMRDHYASYTRPLSGKLEPGETREIALKDDEDMDVDLIEHLRKNLTDTKAKDGFAAGLFPLTLKAQAGYRYTLLKRERQNGRDTWRIHFKPKDTSDFDWEGDAWIDTEAYQPVLVQTRLSRGVPFLVKTMLGTNVPGLGFSATYAAQPDGTWFPVTFGTEFKIHVLFLFHREVVLNLQNRDFQKTHTEAHIVDSAPQEP